MREITVKVYAFAELSEAAKERALTAFRDVNVEFNWWEGSYYTIRARSEERRVGKEC